MKVVILFFRLIRNVVIVCGCRFMCCVCLVLMCLVFIVGILLC